MDTKMMKCGHAANGVTLKDEPVCVICAPREEAYRVDEPPVLNGREAHCSYVTCNSRQPSSTNLAFFKHHPDKDHDEYYCGCLGWD
jgi:hypothetical protein